jgi:hypothetical protein
MTGLACLLLLALVSLAGCNSGSKPAATAPVPSSGANIKPPEIVMVVAKPTLSLSGLGLSLEASIENPNESSINIDDLKFTVRNEQGGAYGQATINGGLITSKASRTFSGNIQASSEAALEKKLVIDMETRAVSDVAAVAARASSVYSLPEFSRLIITPKITLQPKITNLILDGKLVNVAGKLEASLTNLNPFKMDVGSVAVTVKGKTGTPFFNSMLKGESLSANGTYKFSSDLTMPLQALNEGGITVVVDAVGAIGQSSIPVKNSVGVTAPRLKDMIAVPLMTIDTSDIQSNWQKGETNPVFAVQIQANLQNDNIFKLNVSDLHVNVQKPKDTVISSVTIPAAAYYLGIPPTTTTSVYSNWTSFKWEQIGPQGGDATVYIDTTIGIDGINERIPIGASAIIPFKAQWAP